MVTQEGATGTVRGIDIQWELVEWGCGGFNRRAKGIFSKEIKRM